jgi:copper(I)-binding protein
MIEEVPVTASHLSRRSSRPGARRARLAATTLLAGLAALATITACGSGQYAQTANQVPGVPGTNVNVGPNGNIQLRNVVVAYDSPTGYPAGATAPLVVRIFNNGQDPIQLTGVDAPGAAGSVTLTSGSATPTAVPSPTTASPTATAPTSPGASPTATPTGSPSPTPTVTAEPALNPANQFPITIPPQTWADLVPGQGQYLVLNDLTNAVAPGQTVGVTFQFSGGTTASLQVPVDLPTGSAARGSAQPGEGEPQPQAS